MEYPIARLYTDARVARIYAGTSEVMKVIIAKSLGLWAWATSRRRPTSRVVSEPSRGPPRSTSRLPPKPSGQHGVSPKAKSGTRSGTSWCVPTRR